MSSPSGRFSATAERSVQSGLETGGCESGGIRCEIWPGQGRDGGFCEEEKTYATRDWPDAQGALEYKPLRELPDLSSMKRIITHPPAPKSGRQYWRSAAELSDTPEFRAWLEREFPSGAAQLNGDEWSRRSFLKLMGASVALAGFGVSSCRRPEAHLVPFTKSVEWTIPGKFLYYTTAIRFTRPAMAAAMCSPRPRFTIFIIRSGRGVLPRMARRPIMPGSKNI